MWGSRLLLAPHLQGPVDDVSHNQKHHSVNVHGATALPDAVCVHHVKDPAQDARVELPVPHVVELGAQQQCGHDVHDREDDPEDHVAFAKDLQGEPNDQQVGKRPPRTMPSPAARLHSPHQ